MERLIRLRGLRSAEPAWLSADFAAIYDARRVVQCCQSDATEGALQRLSLGVYGYCQSCGVELAYEHLLSHPCDGRCRGCAELEVCKL